MINCLFFPQEISYEEIKSVVKQWSENELVECLNTLGKQMYSSWAQDDTQDEMGEARTQTWKQNIAPWLKKCWPKAAKKNTSETSHELLKLILLCGKAFPEAVKLSLDLNLLWPNNDLEYSDHSLLSFILGQIENKGYAEQFPDQTFQLLKKIVPKNTPYSLPDLQTKVDKVLNLIFKTKPDLKSEWYWET